MGRLKPESTFELVAGNLEGPFREAARAGVSVLTGVTFGLVPALRATSVDLGPT